MAGNAARLEALRKKKRELSPGTPEGFKAGLWGRKIRSKGMGRGLGVGRGTGPIGRQNAIN